MPAPALISAGATVAAAALGYLLLYISNRRLDRQRAQLVKVNAQLAEYYGPLYALTQSNGKSYRAMCERFDPLGLFDKRDPESVAYISHEQRQVYRRWMLEVLQPTNKEARAVLINRADLLVGATLPSCALDFISHVATYDVLLSEWGAGDTEELFSLVPYPQDFTDYVKEAFLSLQAEQKRLSATIVAK